MQKLIIAIMMIAMSPSVWAQGTFRYGPDERAGEWNVSLAAVYQGEEGSSSTNGAGLKIKDDWGFGFNMDYNFTNHLALGFDMTFLKPRYEATYVPGSGDPPVPGEPVTVSHKASIFHGQLKGTYNLLAGPFTPYADVAFGWSHIDSNVADGPPITGCWWDPWWGWVCRSSFSTYDDSDWTYGGGLGVRWDVSRDMFVRVNYNVLRMDIGRSSGSGQFNTTRFEIGFRY
jgi:opacity protein-like surface antigen